ncbi:hypothetical protein ACFV5J_20530 [Streptomyces zaomyceticus]|uniref:hypothetical protein n=1 Tax=Streptomyces zaomyceticus TaxID=68286 RepID=UPI00364FF51A
MLFVFSLFFQQALGLSALAAALTAGALAIAVFGSMAAASVETALRASLLISAAFLALTTLASLRLPGRRA